MRRRHFVGENVKKNETFTHNRVYMCISFVNRKIHVQTLLYGFRCVDGMWIARRHQKCACILHNTGVSCLGCGNSHTQAP